jgi:hypothetical protein
MDATVPATWMAWVLKSAPCAVAAQATDLADTANAIHFDLLSAPAVVAGQAADLADAVLHGHSFLLDRRHVSSSSHPA